MAVVGAGPAGLFAALAAAAVLSGPGGAGGKVVIFEKNAKPGRKLLLSGAGQCNVTHLGGVEDFLEHYGPREGVRRFMKKVLHAYPPQKLISYLKEGGMTLTDNGEGKLFPASGRAMDILNLLVDQAGRRGAVMVPRQRVVALEPRKEGFTIRFEQGPPAEARKVIIASRGRSYPKTGSSGDGFTLAAALGHRISPVRPALTGVTVDTPGLSTLSGLSFPEAEMALYRDSRRLFSRRGALLITHRGFSGPLILNNSRDILPQDRLVIDFSGEGQAYRLQAGALLAAEGKKTLANILALPGLPKRLVEWSLDQAGADGMQKGAETSKKTLSAVLASLTAAEFTVAGLGGWNEAMVTAGGVDLGEINPTTLESRIVPGLYWAGEVVDVDGDTGGYNLQAAFSTGFLAGTAAGTAALKTPV